MAECGASLGDVFKSFCSFGGGKDGPPLMENAKFAKLTRDCKLLDKKLTSTECDIIFAKVKAKTERKITFHQFEEALKLMAQKKYPGDEDGLSKLHTQILAAKGPSTAGTTKVTGGAVNRLTDTAKYTGSHKQRFDDSGKGRGIEGRKDIESRTGYVQGFKKQEK